MKNKLLISVEDISLPPWLKNAENFIAELLEKRGHTDWELSVLFCSDALIRSLNREYRNVDAATDVLSFESGTRYTDENGDERYLAGDIAVSVDFLYKNARDFNVCPDEELKRLLIHGILHLEGMDHGENHMGDAVYCEMIALQEQLLTDFISRTVIEEK
ncbi:rRNA maturation RNase YbeY [Treponema sp. OMZ 840]|uniref:rRNA maturation RNase YbeY n=1 Tax=Treponema sp. OMZ 840 TaxID=244313 RepID=UPI003D94032E